MEKKYGNTAGFFEWVAAPKSKMKSKRLDARTKQMKRENKMRGAIAPKGGKVQKRIKLGQPPKKAKPLVRL